MIEILEILENNLIAKDTFKMVLKTNNMAKKATCGQFINISLNDKERLLRRPISINEIIDDKIVINYKILGDGTKILSQMKKFDKLNVLGPLGKGFNVLSNNSLLIGGGIGCSPLLELAKKLDNPTIILGFKTKEEIYDLEKFSSLGNIIITTDDGSYGFKGHPLEYLKSNNLKFDVFYACGPLRMLEGLEKLYSDKEAYLSYEQHMACGVGLCHGCVVGHPHKCVCTEGPVFKVGELYGSKC